MVDLLVQATVDGGHGRPSRSAVPAQGGALGPVEIEQRVVDVEEDGAEAGAGYLAR